MKPTDRDKPVPNTHDHPESLVRLRSLFDEVVAVPIEQRSDWMLGHVAEADDRASLLRLLQADDGDHGLLDTPVAELASRMTTESPILDGLVGQRIGAYRLARLLGTGGMAAVFLGERDTGDFQQQVAVKLLRRGLYSELEQRLFLRERQLLANLSHPNIAPLFDGGVTAAGIPYLVMEYVAGAPITEHARQRDLDVTQRLHLMLTACRAVEAAHRSLIVHRDIKPSNILVGDEGTVKLIDFGIAKLLDDDAEQVTVGVFTPDYAAPEQRAGLAITTATDVYALGVVLHELLLGVRPDQSATQRPSLLATEAAAAVGSSPKPAPSSARLASALRGDLDNILLKALSSEPQLRYPSAGALADDIQRHLDGLPVVAHPPSAWYRTRKFAARHKGGVGFGFAFALAIFSALGIAVWQAELARKEAVRADAQAARAISVRDFMVSLFDAAKLKLAKDQQPTPAQLVSAAKERVETDAKMPASTRADVLATLGEVSMVNGDLDGALDLMDRAITLKQQIYPASDPQLWNTQVQRASLLTQMGRSKETLEPLKALLMYFRVDNSSDAVEGLQILAATQIRNGEVDGAIATAREAAAKATMVPDLDPIDVMQMRTYPAMALIVAGRYVQGAPELETALQEWRSRGLAQGAAYADIANNLAVAKVNMGDPVGAERVFTEITTIERKLNPALGKNAISLRNLAGVRIQLGMYADAESVLQEAQTLDEATLPENSLSRANTWMSVATLAYAQGSDAAAERSLQKTFRLCAEPGGNTEDKCAGAHQLRALLLLRAGRLDEADAEIAQALEQRIRVYGEKHVRVASGYVVQADLALARSDSARALLLSEQALAILREKKAGRGQDALLAGIVHANALLQVDRASEARTEIEAMIADWQQRMPQPTPQQFDVFALHAIALAATGEHAKATAEARQAVALGLPAEALNAGLRNQVTALAADTRGD